ncbi:hypothetical protein M758_12G020800 [Ceratodon purpureus]|nr:hypothetical protein M758_12G020800 [Ceratodon purpureus]
MIIDGHLRWGRRPGYDVQDMDFPGKSEISCSIHHHCSTRLVSIHPKHTHTHRQQTQAKYLHTQGAHISLQSCQDREERERERERDCNGDVLSPHCHRCCLPFPCEYCADTPCATVRCSWRQPARGIFIMKLAHG